MKNIQDQIAQRAFELFEARGGQHGYHIEDWLKAEQDVRGKTVPKKKSPAKKAPVAEKTPSAAKVKKTVTAKSKTVKTAAAKKATVKK